MDSRTWIGDSYPMDDVTDRGSSEVTLRPMTPAEYEAWASVAIVSYAHDVSLATGEPDDVTLKRANEQFPMLLPDGLATARTWLMMILDGDGTAVGAIWIGPHPANPNWAFVWDIKINEPYQRRGFGRAAMLAAEQLAVDNGHSEIGLSVFGFNEHAQHLYATLGYRVVSTSMTKTLSGS